MGFKDNCNVSFTNNIGNVMRDPMDECERDKGLDRGGQFGWLRFDMKSLLKCFVN